MNKTLRIFLIFFLIAAWTVFAAPSASAHNSPIAFRQGSMIASAVFVPAQVSKLGFVTSGLIDEVLVKEGDTVNAGDVLIILTAPELQFAVTAAEAALRSAQVNAELQRYGRVKERRNGKIFWTQLPKEFIEIADIKVLQAQAALESAQATLAQTALVAPFDGTTTSLDVVPGEVVQAGEVVVTLATLNNLQLETTDLSERDITKVNVGDLAEISVEALGEIFEGEVTAISPKAEIVGGDVVFKIIIKLREQPIGLRWGMTAEVNFSGK